MAKNFPSSRPKPSAARRSGGTYLLLRRQEEVPRLRRPLGGFARDDGKKPNAIALPNPAEGLAPCSVGRWFDGQAKRSGGNTGNTGNPLPQSGASDSSTISSASVYPPAAGLRRVGLAETGGNWRKPSGIEGGGKITSLVVVEFAHARPARPAMEAAMAWYGWGSPVGLAILLVGAGTSAVLIRFALLGL
jgi:hypothetical protein